MPDSAGVEEVHGPVIPAEVEGIGVGGARIEHPPLGQVGDEVKGGGVHGSAALFEHACETGIHLAEQLPGNGRGAAEVLDQRAHHAGDERRPNVVTHDVADEHPDPRRREFDDVKEIAADGP